MSAPMLHSASSPQAAAATSSACDSDAVQVMWDNLVEWLEQEGCQDPAKYVKLVTTSAGGGRGLVAKQDIPPSTTLISIPPRALLNCNTLKPLYPPHFYNSLSSTQFVSLHLALQYTLHDRAGTRPRLRATPSSSTASPSSSAAARDRFWPFIQTIPRTDGFETLPLSWSINRRSNSELQDLYDADPRDLSLLDRVVDSRSAGFQSELLECLPMSVQARCADVEKRFKSDWFKVKQVWEQHLQDDPTDGPPLAFFDFVLGWLNVNTRCVYFDMGRKNSDNLTLAPMIDMINHADSRQTKPIQSIKRGLSFASPPPGSSDPVLKAGDELAFSYGAHEDAMLIAEYGFTLHAPSRDGNPFNNVDVTRIIEQMFQDAGEQGQIKKGLLQDTGYWGEMTLQRASHSLPTTSDQSGSGDIDGAAASPADQETAYASWRVLVALRLLHLDLPTDRTSAPFAATGPLAGALEPWYAVLAGDSDTISPSNEKRVQESVRTIASVVVLQGKDRLPALEALERRWRMLDQVPASLRSSLAMLKGIYLDESAIARGLIG